MKDKPNKPKPTGKTKHKAKPKTATGRGDKTPRGGDARRGRSPQPPIDSDPEKKTAMLGGKPIDGALAQQALTRLLDRYRRSMEMDLLCLTECRKKLGLKRTAIKTLLQTVGFVGTQATQDLVLDCVVVAEQAIQTLMKLAIEDRQPEAVNWLASRSNLASYRPNGKGANLETLITKFNSTKALWNESKNFAGDANKKASRTPLVAWAHTLLNASLFWNAMLPHMPKQWHGMRWTDFQVSQLGTNAAIPWPTAFVETSKGEHFVDEIAMPFLRAIEKSRPKQFHKLVEGSNRRPFNVPVPVEKGDIYRTDKLTWRRLQKELLARFTG